MLGSTCIYRFWTYLFELLHTVSFQIFHSLFVSFSKIAGRFMISGKKLLNDKSLELNVALSQKKNKVVCSAETCRANPGEVLMDTNSLAKIKNIIPNTL